MEEDPAKTGPDTLLSLVGADETEDEDDATRSIDTVVYEACIHVPDEK